MAVGRLRNLVRRIAGAADANGSSSVKLTPTMYRPFKTADMRPVPDGWRVGGPQYVGIATTKAGTTWWHTLLERHPSVVENRLGYKELWYFPHFNHEGMSDEAVSVYRQAFAAPEDGLCGEWTPSYLHSPCCVEFLAQVVPQAKILLILRDPIDRLRSQLNQLYRYRLATFDLPADSAHVLKTLSLFPEAYGQCFSAEPLKRLWKHFPREQVLALQYEQCVNDTVNQLARTYRFLGIDDTFAPDGLKQAVNRYPYMVPPFTDEQRQRFADAFRDDVLELAEMLPEFDLSLWKDFIPG